MKLSDVMSSMNLSTYAEVGLVLFLLAFAAVVFDVLRRGRALEALAHLPLESCERASSDPKNGAQ